MISALPLGSEWRREALRTNLWLVPSIEVIAAVALYVATHALDNAAYDGSVTLTSIALELALLFGSVTRRQTT